MVATREALSESYPATPASVPVVRHAVADYARRAGATDEQLDRLRLAVSEAVTNTVVHAYREQAGEIHLTAAVVADELWVLIADDGVGFQTPARAPGLGLGLALIADASDEFLISERGEGGTEARIRVQVGERPLHAG